MIAWNEARLETVKKLYLLIERRWIEGAAAW